MGAKLAVVLELQVKLVAGCVEPDIEAIAETARRSYAWFLNRDRTLGRRCRVKRRRCRLDRLVAVDVRQPRYVILRAREVERRGQVATDRPPPRRDVRLVHTESLLQEADQRRVVEHLRADPTPSAPRRDHEQRYADAEAV